MQQPYFPCALIWLSNHARSSGSVAFSGERCISRAMMSLPSWKRLIPAALLADRCPGPCCNGGDAVWVCGECVPCGTVGVDDGGVAVVDAIAEMVGPEKGPGLLLGSGVVGPGAG